MLNVTSDCYFVVLLYLCKLLNFQLDSKLDRERGVGVGQIHGI